MFCPKCGNHVPDGAKFCAKCGNMIKVENEKEKETNATLRQPVIIGVGIAVILLIAIFVGIRSHHTKSDSAGTEVIAGAEAVDRTESTSDPISDTSREEQENDTDEIVTSSAITLDGNYKNLKSVVMQESSNGSVQTITYNEDSAFPVLESIKCGAVMKKYSSGETSYFEAADFPALKNVTMTLVNKYIDEDIMMTYLLFEDMYKSGTLQNFDVKLIHTIEDLYGTWADSSKTLSLTFGSDGTIRIAGYSNLFGADVMKYKEVDDNTLSLSADTSGLLGMVSVNMNYEIFGDNLWIELAGQQFTLIKKD